MKLAQFYHGRLALADLDTGAVTAITLPQAALEKGLGGWSLAAVLLADYPDALCLCAGPLTGSYAPASGLATLSFIRSTDGRPVHAAIPLGHGAWLRQSGFDALVVTGRGSVLRIIRCREGNCFIEDAQETELVSSRARLRAALLRRTESGRAALMLGGSAQSGSPAAAGAEYGSLPAGAIAGPAMRERNILAVCLEGGSPLPAMPLPLDNPLRRAAGAAAASPLADFFLEAKKDASGLCPSRLDDSAGGQPPAVAHGAPGLSLKSAACFHCPAPCLAWIKTGRDAHLLLADHGAFAAAFEACGQNTPACLAACDEAGLDPVAAAPLLKDAAVNAYAAVLGAASWPGGDTPPPGEQLTEAERAGLLLGMCPRLVRRASGLSRSVFELTLGEKADAILSQSENPLGEVFI